MVAVLVDRKTSGIDSAHNTAVGAAGNWIVISDFSAADCSIAQRLCITNIAMQPSIQTLPHWAQLALLIVPAVSAVFAAVGLLLTFYQSRRTNAQSRAALVASCLKGFVEDEEIQHAFYAIEYSEFRYDDAFHKSEKERGIDKLLRHFANIALAWQAGLLSTRDVRPVQYYVLRVMRNPEVQKYLTFIAEWSKEAGVGEHPYAVLGELNERLAK